jgi:hypothetical protein
MNPIEGMAVRGLLTAGGKFGDLAINTAVPLLGYAVGGAVGGVLGAPEGGFGAVPGTIAGGKIGGAITSGAADALVQARQYFRGERNDFSYGSMGASAILGAVIPKPVDAAGSIAATFAKTIATRSAQGAVLGAAHQVMSNMFDGQTINLGDAISSGEWGALFGAGAGTLEGGAGTGLSLLKSINGKTPAEAAQAIEASSIPEEQKTALQKNIEAMVGYHDAQGESSTTPPATPEGALVQENPPVVKSAADSASVFEDQHALDQMAEAAQTPPSTITDSERNYMLQVESEADRPVDIYGALPNGEASALRLQGENPPVANSAEASAQVFRDLMGDEQENLRAWSDQIDALNQAKRAEVDPENLPSMSDQAQKMYDEYGFITPKVAMSLAGGAGGALYGQSQPGTPEQKAELALTYGALGLAAGFGAGTGIESLVERGGLKSLQALTDPTVLKSLWQRGSVNEALTYTRDAADTKAIIAGQESQNVVGNAIARVFPKSQQQTAANALSFMVESQGNPDELDQMASKIAGSSQASPYWRDQATQAIQFAKDNYQALRPIADTYGELTSAQAARENAAGIDTLQRDGYVMHAQDIDSPLSNPLIAARSAGVAANFRKVRAYDTFADSIAAGIDPKSIDAVDLLGARVTNGEKLVNRRQWIEGMSAYTDPATGNPLVQPIQTVTRADGSTYEQPPRGYSIQQAGNQRFALLDGYGDIFSALNDPSAWLKSPAGRAALQLNGLGKSMRLFFDTYHLGRVAMMETAAKLAGGADQMSDRLPAFANNRGVTILDNTPEELSNIARDEQWTPQELAKAQADKQSLQGLVDAGMNVGGVSDALHEDLVHSMPVVGPFNKWLFGQYQRGAMSEVALMELERQRSMYPDLEPDELNRQVAQDVNTWFRNLGRQGLFKSQTARDTARFVALAPQWNEGAIRQEVGAVTQGVQSAVDAATGKRWASGLLLRGAGVMIGGQFLANQLLNMYTRGHPTWDNPEEGVGSKISAWIPDKIGGGPGFFLNPLGIAGETAHLLMQGYERTQDFGDTLREFARGRLSSAMQPVMTWATGRDGLGRPINPNEMWKQVALSAVPLPIPSGAVTGAIDSAVTGQRQEAFAGQIQKQLMSSVGIRTDQAPSPGQRIAALARTFNATHGITQSAEFYGGDYSALTNALRVGNQPAAQAAMQDLLKKKTANQIDQYFEKQPTFPATGQRGRESQFFQGLSQEQKQAYLQALQDRQSVSAQAREILRYVLRSQLLGEALSEPEPEPASASQEPAPGE